MEIPLNAQAAPGAAYPRSVQFGIFEGERRVIAAKQNPEQWTLQSRLLFIYEGLSQKHPHLFPRENKWNWLAHTLTLQPEAVLARPASNLNKR